MNGAHGFKDTNVLLPDSQISIVHLASALGPVPFLLYVCFLSNPTSSALAVECYYLYVVPFYDYENTSRLIVKKVRQ